MDEETGAAIADLWNHLRALKSQLDLVHAVQTRGRTAEIALMVVAVEALAQLASMHEEPEVFVAGVNQYFDNTAQLTTAKGRTPEVDNEFVVTLDIARQKLSARLRGLQLPPR